MKKQTSINDEFFASLGRSIANFQSLELLICQLTWGFINENYAIGMSVTSKMDFKVICTLLPQLVKLQISDATIHERVDELMKVATKINGDRNKHVHSYWILGGKEAPTSAIRLKFDRYSKDFKTDNELMDVTVVDKLSTKIENLYDEIQVFMRDMIKVGYFKAPPITESDCLESTTTRESE
jgi:hypothetical protein